MEQTFMFLHITREENFTIFDTKWIPQTAKFVGMGRRDTNGTGLIKLYELNGNQIDVYREINKQNALKCGAFGLSRTQNAYLATGDFAGSLQIINMDRLDGCVYNVYRAHNGVINAIDTVGSMENHGASEIVTGGQDGMIKIWDPRCKNAVVQIESDTDIKRDCWSVAFGNSYNNNERCVCAGFDNGDIKLFDLRTLTIRWEDNVRNGICDIEMNNKYEPLRKILAGTTFADLNVFGFNGNSWNKPKKFHKTDADPLSINKANPMNGDNSKPIDSTIWCVRHLPQNNNIFASCGGSGRIRLWQSPKEGHRFASNYLKVVCELSVSKKPIHCFDWSPDRAGLAICSSFDKKLRVIVTVHMPLA